MDKLSTLPSFLKKRFFGIDEVLDEVAVKIKPWYYTNEAMMRPQIISLWGMTGVGKTSMIRFVAQHLDRPIIQLDLGEYTNSQNKEFGLSFYDEYYEYSGKPVIIMIDEFHIARTMDEEGAENDHSSFRNLWNLLSDGEIHIDCRAGGNWFYSGEGNEGIVRHIEDIMMDYKEDLMKMKKYQDGLLKPKSNSKKVVIKDEDDEDDDEFDKKDYGRLKKRMKRKSSYFSSYFLSFLTKYLEINSHEYRDKLNKDFEKTVMELISKVRKNKRTQPRLDFSKALIFVCGNLDELYIGSGDFDPDCDFETLVEQAKQITVSDVKELLLGRFRAEQIGRLGNNHIVYPPLDRKAYEKIIRNDLKRVRKFYKTLNFDFKFDKSVIDIIFREGVFPTQGARSVLSTINTFFESVIVDYYQVAKEKGCFGLAIVSYDRDSGEFVFSHDKFNYRVSAVLKVETMRKPHKSSQSVSTSVHEAGHVAVSILRCGEIPSKATAFSARSQAYGAVYYPWKPKNKKISMLDRKRIVCRTLAGLAAERVFFGIDNQGIGATSDLEAAYENLYEAFSKCGFGGDYGVRSMRGGGSQKNMPPFTKKQLFIMRKAILNEGRIAENLIFENIDFVKSLADAMLENSSIDRNDIIKIMKKHKISCPQSFDYVDAYDSFDGKALYDPKLESEILSADIEEMAVSELEIKKDTSTDDNVCYDDPMLS